MSELKTFWAIKTEYTLYKISADNRVEAEDLLKRKTPLAATGIQKGVSEIRLSDGELSEIKIFDELPALNKNGVDVDE